MDRSVWLDLGQTIADNRVRCSITIVDFDTETGFHTYSVFHGSLDKSSIDTLECPGVKILQDSSGEWDIESLHPLAKKYLLRTWEPL